MDTLTLTLSTHGLVCNGVHTIPEVCNGVYTIPEVCNGVRAIPEVLRICFLSSLISSKWIDAICKLLLPLIYANLLTFLFLTNVLFIVLTLSYLYLLGFFLRGVVLVIKTLCVNSLQRATSIITFTFISGKRNNVKRYELPDYLYEKLLKLGRNYQA